MGQTYPPHKNICLKCKHYLGIKYVDLKKNLEGDQVNVCKAFSDEILDEILLGDNKHLKPLPDQKNDIVFEKS